MVTNSSEFFTKFKTHRFIVGTLLSLVLFAANYYAAWSWVVALVSTLGLLVFGAFAISQGGHSWLSKVIGFAGIVIATVYLLYALFAFVLASLFSQI